MILLESHVFHFACNFNVFNDFMPLRVFLKAIHKLIKMTISFLIKKTYVVQSLEVFFMFFFFFYSVFFFFI